VEETGKAGCDARFFWNKIKRQRFHHRHIDHKCAFRPAPTRGRMLDQPEPSIADSVSGDQTQAPFSQTACSRQPCALPQDTVRRGPKTAGRSFRLPCAGTTGVQRRCKACGQWRAAAMHRLTGCTLAPAILAQMMGADLCVPASAHNIQMSSRTSARTVRGGRRLDVGGRHRATARPVW